MSKFRSAASIATLIALCGTLTAPAMASQRGGGPGQPLACEGKAYVSNSFSDTVTVIDTRANTVLATIPVGKGPVNPTIHPDGRRVFLTSSEGRSIIEIDVATQKVVRTIPAGPNKPSGLAFTPDGRHVVVSFFQTREEAVAGSPRAAGGPRSTPIAGGRVLTLWNAETKEALGSLRIMDLATGAMSDPIKVGMGPERLALSRDGRRAYVANLGSGTVSVVDLAAQRLVATIPTGVAGPFNVSIPRNGRRVFVGNTLGNAMTVIDPATNRIVRTIPLSSPNGMALDREHRRLYVTNFNARTIQWIDVETLALSPPVSVETAPGFLRLTPDGAKGLFVAPYGSGVSVLDVAEMKVVATVPTGRGPSVVAICDSP